jgi:hypothetical protein
MSSSVSLPYPRHHLLIWRTPFEVLIRDIGSALGTRVGRRQLGAGDALVVGEGDEIVLAERTRLFWRFGGPGVPEPVPRAVISSKRSRAAGSKFQPDAWLTIAPADDPVDSSEPPADDRPVLIPRPVSITVRCGDSGPEEVRLEDDMGHELWIRGRAGW